MFCNQSTTTKEGTIIQGTISQLYHLQLAITVHELVYTTTQHGTGVQVQVHQLESKSN